jgi:methylthioribose-1-phosphate isomerase
MKAKPQPTPVTLAGLDIHEDEDETARPNETPNQRWRRLANSRGRNLFAAMDRMTTLAASHHDFTEEEMNILIEACVNRFDQMANKLRNGGEDIFS